MRRIAWGAAALAAGLLAGCGTIDAGLSPQVRTKGAAAGPRPSMTASTADDFAAPTGPAYSREAVPDSVMLRDQAESGYRGAVVP